MTEGTRFAPLLIGPHPLAAVTVALLKPLVRLAIAAAFLADDLLDRCAVDGGVGVDAHAPPHVLGPIAGYGDARRQGAFGARPGGLALGRGPPGPDRTRSARQAGRGCRTGRPRAGQGLRRCRRLRPGS